MNKYFLIYYQFNLIIKDLIRQGDCFKTQRSIQILKSIQKFFRIFVSVQNPILHQIIHFIYTQLQSRYSQTSAIQLMKKLILNRFLLNPSFYVLYNDPNQNQIKKYVQFANNIRLLFYKKKVQQMAQKTQNPYINQIIQINSDICYSFDYCLKKQIDLTFSTQNKSFLYINDKILKNQMQIFYEQFTQNSSHTSPRQQLKVKNVITDYSLSFSLVKNDQNSRNQLTSHPLLQNLSEVKFSSNTNRSNTNIKDNHSIRVMYDQLKGMKSQNQIPPRSPEKGLRLNTKQYNKDTKKSFHEQEIGNLSQLSRKHHEINNQTRLHQISIPTDRQILDELIEYRKQYGQRKKILKLKMEEKRSRFTKRMAILNAFSMRFVEQKNIIQQQNNILYVHLSTYA